MTVAVVAESPTRYRAWLANMARPAAAAATATARGGEAVFLAQSCASCHSIRGTAAAGTVGPDLTHLATAPVACGGHDPEHAGLPPRLDREPAGRKTGRQDAVGARSPAVSSTS